MLKRTSSYSEAWRGHGLASYLQPIRGAQGSRQRIRDAAHSGSDHLETAVIRRRWSIVDIEYSIFSLLSLYNVGWMI